MNSKCRFLLPSLVAAALLPVAGYAETTEELSRKIRELEEALKSLKQQVATQPQPLKEQQSPVTTGVEGTKFTYGGYAKLQAISSRYGDGVLSPGTGGHDFYVPAETPVGGDSSQDFDFSARESRLFLKTETTLSGGEKLKSYFEMDFLVTSPSGGDQRVSNGYSLGLRHAYFEYDNWLLGQSWTTFQNTGVLPDAVDFIAATEGTVFVRQPQLRYTNGGLQISLENIETTVTPFGGGARIITDDGIIPDLVVRYNMGNYSIAGIVRQLSYEFKDDKSDVDDSIIGYGISGAGKIPLGADDLRFMLTAGSGLGRYVGLNFINDAVLDGAGDLDAINLVAGFISYRHPWNEKWRSSFTISALRADNDVDLTGSSANKLSTSYRLNLLYSPMDKLTFGIELMRASRELEGGQKGDMDRLVFSGKYNF